MPLHQPLLVSTPFYILAKSIEPILEWSINIIYITINYQVFFYFYLFGKKALFLNLFVLYIRLQQWRIK